MRKEFSIGFTPREYQKAAHRSTKRWRVLVWHRRAGKTTFCVIELLLAAYNFRGKDGRFAYIAPFYGQAKSVCWDILKRYASKIEGTIIKEAELSVVLPNGCTIRLFGADNPNSLRGLYFDGVVIDEVADIKTSLWGEIVRPALTDRQGWAMFIGTPKGVNLFSELYHDALRDSDWFGDMQRASDTKIIPEEELAQARKTMTESQYAQEFECDFSAAVENALIPLWLAREASTRTVARHDHSYAPMVLGVDVARYGDDRSVIFPRQGLAAFQPYVYRNLNVMALAAQVADVYQKLCADAVLVDEGAMGAGVIDRLRSLGGFNVLGINFGAKAISPKYVNLRSEMWDKMATWLKEGGCIPNDEVLIADLCAPTYSFDNAANRFGLESKDSMKKRGLPSPDMGDALALTFAVPISKRPEHERYATNRKENRVLAEYNPYE